MHLSVEFELKGSKQIVFDRTWYQQVIWIRVYQSTTATEGSLAMLFLSEAEKKEWQTLAAAISTKSLQPERMKNEVLANFWAAFCFYVGILLINQGECARGKEWLAEGMANEEDGLFCSAFMVAFLERQKNRLLMPSVAFSDPRPFVHFATVPEIHASREQFIRHCGSSVPRFTKPLKIMDIGCGSGTLLAAFLNRLREIGKAKEVGEILLIDPSPAMIALARDTLQRSFPTSVIKTVTARIEDLTTSIDSNYDIALSSLAYHHMPAEAKITHLGRLARFIDHFLLFELDANHDTPELHSPELALSVYQVYGRAIDLVFAHDAPLDVAYLCVDAFLMCEMISLLTQPRGVRTEYHMLRRQWHDLIQQALGARFACLSDSTCYADTYLELFAMHFGKSGL